MRLVAVLGLVLPLIAACASHRASVVAPETTTAVPAAVPPGAPASPVAVAPRPARPAPLTGHLTRAAVEDYETWKALRAQDYTPDAESVRAIAARGGDVETLVILATWCPDSKRDLPRYFKILDQAGIGLEKVALVGVDRTKKDAGGLTERHGITRVPTFVFFRGGAEIGRVVERPATTLEGDIAAILAKQ